MKRRKISTDKAPKPVAPYSQAIKIDNADSIVFVSGQVSIDPNSGEAIEGNIKEQTRRCIENIKGIVQDSGGKLEDITKVTVYLKDIEKFEEMNEVYEEYFGDSEPARAAVEVSDLAADFEIEIEAIATL